MRFTFLFSLLPALTLASLREKSHTMMNVQMFEEIDEDRSGFIEEHEGLNGFDSWQPYDTNQDGKLSLREFSTLGNMAQRLEDASLLERKAEKSKVGARARCIPGSAKDIFMFELADKDKDGYVTEREGLEKFNWKVFDNNEDGKLDPKEFMFMVQDALRLEDEGPELKDRPRRFSATVKRHGASMSEGANMMRGRTRQSQLPHAPNEQLPKELSSFEEDHWNEMSEYFGPFRIDYSDHTIEVPGWNFVVVTSESVPGRGNVIVGDQNFYSDAANSFVAGKHHTARGFEVSVAGGKDNIAEGVNVVIVGGEQNAARGNLTVINGGYRNEANGNYAVVEGGVKNVADGDFATVSGGATGIAAGYATSISGGKANEAVGRQGSATGGSGNKVKGIMSVIAGGVGQDTYEKFEAAFVKLTDQDRETVMDPDHTAESHFTS